MTVGKKTVLVVGGASGIGRALIQGLGGDEYEATVWDVLPGDATQPSVAEHRRVDIGEREAVLRELGSLSARGVRFHAVVVSAGVHATCPVERMSDELLDRVMHVNFVAHARLVRDVLPLMLPGGRIIGVSSIAAAVGIPMSSAYSASKAALESFYESLAIELRSKQVWPVVVRPGNVNTGFNESGNQLPDDGEAELAADHRRVVEMIHSRHGMPPGAVARVIRNAIEAPRPRFCYVVGQNAKRATWATRILGPDAALMLLRRHFGFR
jgi:NAD(P)-dependent dehydrogenase (short-subunit alcohol dehydrogenase family)